MARGFYGVFMGFIGVPLINGGSDRGFGGVYGVYGGGNRGGGRGVGGRGWGGSGF